MQHERTIFLLFIAIFVVPIFYFPSIKLASCFLARDSTRFKNHQVLLGENCPHHSNSPNSFIFFKNSSISHGKGLQRLKLSPSEVPEGHRPLNYHEKKTILHKILFERNDHLIKDLVSTLSPEELQRRRPRAHKDKKVHVKVERAVHELVKDEDSEVLEDTGYDEPTQINHVRPGDFVYFRNEVYTVASIQHIAQARAKGHYKAKFQLLHTVKETSFSLPDACKITVLHPKKIRCVYKGFDDETNSYLFKTEKTEVRVPKGINISSLKYMKPGLEVAITRWKDKILGLFVPFHIEYKVVSLNTGNYAATLDNGLTVLVPTYIKVNDYIEVSTKSCEFLRRTKIS